MVMTSQLCNNVITIYINTFCDACQRVYVQFGRVV